MTDEPMRDPSVPDAAVPDAPAQSPLHDLHQAAGAVFTDFAGWQMPLRYGSELDEHRAVRERVGLFDLSHMAEIAVIGPEAGAALDRALVGGISTMTEGRARYSLLLNDHGGVIDDVIVYRTGSDRFLVVANAGNRDAAASAIRERAHGTECEVFDETDDLALLAVQGPAALETLSRLDPPLDGDPGALGRYRAAPMRWQGHEVLVARTGYTGEDGFELTTSPEAARALWSALLEAGEPAGILPAGLAARDTLRLEAGMPLYGHELSGDIRPDQVGLARVVRLDTDTEFVGRHALERDADPTRRVLVGLVSEGRRAGRQGYPVRDGDRVVGEVTSGALSPTLGHPVAMAFVDPSVAAVGTVLQIDVRGTALPATVTELPFHHREARS